MDTHSQNHYLRVKFRNLLRKIEEEGPSKVPHLYWFISIYEWTFSASGGNASSLLGLIDALSECRVFACERDAAYKKGLFSWFIYPSEFWFKRKMAYRLSQFERKLKHGVEDRESKRYTNPAYYGRGIIFNEIVRSIENYVIHSRQARKYGFSAIAITSRKGIIPFASNVFDSMAGKFDISILVEPVDLSVNIIIRRKKVVMQMLEAVGLYEESKTQLDIVDLLKEVRKALEGKRYLIVFNGVRSHDAYWYSDLGFNLPQGGTFEDKLSHALPKGSGGAVIVTTEWDDKAIEMVGNSKNVIRLDNFLRDLSWVVFDRALNEKGIPPVPDEILSVEKLKNYILENSPAVSYPPDIDDE